MDSYTNISINYRKFTEWAGEQMLAAQKSAAAVRKSEDEYHNPEALQAAARARAEAIFDAWKQVVTLGGGNYDMRDWDRLSDLL